MTVYADYTYYTGTFLGTAISSGDFAALEFRAAAQLNQLTFGRAATAFAALENVNAIKNATCAIAEELQRQDSNDGVDGIQSESQGQYSVTYAAGSNRSKSSQTKISEAARLWLANTGLDFAGFYSGEYGGVANDP